MSNIKAISLAVLLVGLSFTALLGNLHHPPQVSKPHASNIATPTEIVLTDAQIGLTNPFDIAERMTEEVPQGKWASTLKKSPDIGGLKMYTDPATHRDYYLQNGQFYEYTPDAMRALYISKYGPFPTSEPVIEKPDVNSEILAEMRRANDIAEESSWKMASYARQREWNDFTANQTLKRMADEQSRANDDARLRAIFQNPVDLQGTSRRIGNTVYTTIYGN